jgi:hypothetical protein
MFSLVKRIILNIFNNDKSKQDNLTPEPSITPKPTQYYKPPSKQIQNISTDENQDNESILSICYTGLTSFIQKVFGLIGLLIGVTLIVSSLGLPVIACIYVKELGDRAGLDNSGCEKNEEENNEYRNNLKYYKDISYTFHWLVFFGPLSIPLSIIFMAKATIDYFRI